MHLLEESVCGRLVLHLAGRLRRGAQRSGLFRLRYALHRKTVVQQANRSLALTKGAAPLYQKGMRAREESLFFALCGRVRNYWMGLSLGCYGLFLLALGGILFSFTFWVPRFVGVWEQRVAGSALMVLSLLLLPLNKSLSYAVRKSLFLRGFLCGFSLLSEDRLGNTEKGRERVGGALTAAVLFGALGYLTTPLIALWGLVLLPLLCLFLALPECLLCAIFLVFPVLGLSGHPTILLCGLVGLLWLSYLAKAMCGKRTAESSGFDWACLIFCFSLLLGSFVGFGSRTEGIALAALASMALPARQLLGSRAWAIRARASLLAGAGMCAGVGVMQYLLRQAALQWVDRDRFGDIGGRVVSFFENPNVLAIYLLFCLPMALGAAIDAERHSLVKVAYGICALLCGACLILTWSRGAWLGGMAEVILLLILCNRKTLAISFLLPFFCMPILPFLPRSIRNRFASIGMLGESSIRYRRYTWRGTCSMLKKHPFGIGVGSTAFLRIYPHYAVSGTETVMHAHSLFLHLLAEMGGMGLLSFLLCLFFAFLPFGRGIHLHARCAICGALVMGIFDHLWYAPPMIALFFCLCALACAGNGENGGVLS